MKKRHAILIIFAAVAAVLIALTFFIPSFLPHLLIHFKKEIVRRPEDIENALLTLKNQKQTFNAPHIVFEISRK